MITKKQFLKVLKKALQDKEDTLKYLRGELTKEELEAKGIKLAKPFKS